MTKYATIISFWLDEKDFSYDPSKQSTIVFGCWSSHEEASTFLANYPSKSEHGRFVQGFVHQFVTVQS